MSFHKIISKNSKMTIKKTQNHETKTKAIKPIAPNVARKPFQLHEMDITDWSAINESQQLDLGTLPALPSDNFDPKKRTLDNIDSDSVLFGNNSNFQNSKKISLTLAR